MRFFKLLPNLLALCVLVGMISCDRADDSPVSTDSFYRLNAFETGVNPNFRQVSILFQVKDYDGNGVPGLTEEDFIVTENGGRIDSEANLKIDPDSIPFALKTVLLLDVSSSVTDFVPQIKEATKALVNQKLNNQEIAIYTFDSQTHLILDFTTDKTTLINAIDNLPETNLINSTNLYSGIIEVSDLWQDKYTIDNIEDGSLIVFTDGRHNATQAVSLSDAKSAIAGKKVYIAALNSADLDVASLQQLASQNDHYFLADNIATLEGTFLNIQTEIQNLSKSIYYMFYQSPISDPTPFDNELTVTVKNNRNPEENRRIFEVFSSVGFGG
ncbi:MAG: hypothetical protein ACI9XO_004433 [Paraglaciecola sp.]|jgi:uncharacterized protein YegL